MELIWGSRKKVPQIMTNCLKTKTNKKVPMAIKLEGPGHYWRNYFLPINVAIKDAKMLHHILNQ